MKRVLTAAAAFLLLAGDAGAFCGFYVAKADVKLSNKTSQVIIVRDGELSTITMSSDFSGAVNDFAMVVPVPVVLQKNDIKVVNRMVFDQLDAYSAPRLVEYYDDDPCQTYYYRDRYAAVPMAAGAEKSIAMDEDKPEAEYQVKIEAKYSVGEYDILILSAKESGGLERWLNDNGYKIPEGAKEVLDPYVKSNMKFFVVKVNLEEFRKQGGSENVDGSLPLSPIQIKFSSPKFMLPIRLGMANADGEQDMLVYAFSRKGRVETTNYRTVPMPTGQKVPLFVRDEFSEFYRDTYSKTWKREGKNVVFLEYAWDVTLNGGMKCDPCVGPPPMFNELAEAGVNWLVADSWGGATGFVYFTRMHVTYGRSTFPQDLMFQETPNKQNYQARYVLTNPAGSDFNCSAGQQYIRDLSQRRWNELYSYQWLSGRSITEHRDYPAEYNIYLKRQKENEPKRGGMLPVFGGGNDNTPQQPLGVWLLSLATLLMIMFTLSRRRLTPVQAAA
ncbi:MAG: DUF2330 domain-containing protein [Bacteroidia bacterium]|jgi:hypothetical protein|nr:DUF2330 domain-containing protein [Bacteroidia bacterium]